MAASSPCAWLRRVFAGPASGRASDRERPGNHERYAVSSRHARSLHQSYRQTPELAVQTQPQDFRRCFPAAIRKLSIVAVRSAATD
jgi:hypothetical protein